MKPGLDYETVEDGHLVLRYPRNPTIRINARFLDGVESEADLLAFEVSEFRAGVQIPRGAAAAQELACKLEPFTRAAPITDDESYEHAKAALASARSRRRQTGDFIVVGADPIIVTDDYVYIGEFVCSILDVEKYLKAAADLPLPNNGLVQAAMVMLVVAQWHRQESVETLARRIWDYEARKSP